MKDKDGKEYTYTVTTGDSSESSESWKVDKTEIGNLVSGSGVTHTITGSAYVSGETVIWTSEENSSSKFIGVDGKISVEAGETIEVDGHKETVLSISEDGNRMTTTYTENGDTVTKTYTFTYDEVLTEAEKQKLQEDLPDGQSITDFDGLTKTSWTVQISTESTTTDDADNTVFLDDFLKQNAEGNYVYTDGSDEITFVGDQTSVTTEGGKTTYTLEIEDIDLTDRDKVSRVLTDKYGNNATIDFDEQTVTYTDADGKTYTVHYDTLQTVSVKKEVTDKTTTVTGSGKDADEAEQALIEKIINEVEDAQEKNQKVFVTVKGADGKDQEYELTLKDGELVGIKNGEFEGMEEMGQTELIEWIKENTAINFDADDLEGLTQYLEGQKEANDPTWVLSFHIDLLVDSKLHIEGSDANSMDCVVLGEGLSISVGNSVEDLASGTEKAEFESTISYDDQNGGFYQYNRGDGYEDFLKENAIDTGENKYVGGAWHRYYDVYEIGYDYYKVTGKVAYNLYIGTETDDGVISGGNAERAAADIVKNLQAKGYEDAVAVAFTKNNRTTYKVYMNQANLEAYGYLGDASNKCTADNNPRGYDLALGDLTLVEDGKKIVATGAGTYSYAANLSVKSTEEKSTSSVCIDKISTTTTIEKNGNSGSAISGSYQITENMEVKENDNYIYTGTGEGSYDTYKIWQTRDASSSATGTKYSGSLKLGYTIPEQVTVGDVNVSWADSAKTIEKTRDIDATLSVTTVSTKTETETKTETVTVPVTPPGGSEGGSTETVIPPVVIQTEQLPKGSATVIEETAVAKAAQVPQDMLPQTTIADEATPLASLPQTGQNWALAGLLGAVGALLTSAGFASGKHSKSKRRKDEHEA